MNANSMKIERASFFFFLTWIDIFLQNKYRVAWVKKLLIGKRKEEGCPILYINEEVIFKKMCKYFFKYLQLRKSSLISPIKRSTNLINENVFSTYLWKHVKYKFKHYPFCKNKQDKQYKLRLLPSKKNN